MTARRSVPLLEASSAKDSNRCIPDVAIATPFAYLPRRFAKMAWWGIAIDHVFVYSALAFCDAYSELSRDSGNSKLNEENGQKFKVK